MVEKAFGIMDVNQNGVINYDDLKDVYDVSCNKDFIEGRKSKEQILDEFIDTFEGSQGKKDGTVTHDEWVDYYTDLSMSLPSDDYFCQMMESVWGICEQEETDDYKSTINEYTRVT
jgi:Ca2+-binding EF-hand superfamily protein